METEITNTQQLIDTLSKEQLAQFLDHSMKIHVEFLSWIYKNYPVIIREWERYKQYKYKLMFAHSNNDEGEDFKKERAKSKRKVK